ncbi:MAG: sodium pump decarboxylase subunit gamma [Phycisphaerales bacterium]|jgi:sodium pump decarboxylase gamma subunit|nr:sodium pump decarboxylase subunit gamma [Phycisphaerales bacterium]
MTQGFVFLVVGMGTVFLFLLLMVLTMNLSGKICMLFPEPVVEEPAPRPAAGGAEAEIAAVIAIARAQ